MTYSQIIECPHRESNPGPPGTAPGALTTELSVSEFFPPPVLRTENQTERFFSELNRTRTELFRTSSNCWTTGNFEKSALHKFYTLKLIATYNLCLNFFVLMLFEGTSSRKHEIDKELPYLVMMTIQDSKNPARKILSWLCFSKWGLLLPFYITHNLFYMLFFCISSENFDWFSKWFRNFGEFSELRTEPQPKLENQNWTEPNFQFSSVGSGSLWTELWQH